MVQPKKISSKKEKRDFPNNFCPTKLPKIFHYEICFDA